jgi:hypothetical protein
MRQSPEARLFASFWDDGTLDLLTGGAVALIGVGYVFDAPLVEVIVLPLALAAWAIVHKRVVEPRTGYVEFTRERRARTGRGLLGALALGAGLLALAVVAVLQVRDWPADPRGFVDALPALLIALGAVVAAGLTRAWRFGLYAGLLAAAGLVTVLVGTGPGAPLVAGGLVAWGTGVVLLVRFLAASRRFQTE